MNAANSLPAQSIQLTLSHGKECSCGLTSITSPHIIPWVAIPRKQTLGAFHCNWHLLPSWTIENSHQSRLRGICV
jgi:hypothetical protein